MIIETTKPVQYGTQLPTSNFKIASSPKAFKILSDSLYKNKIRAVVRELACNALDAHTLVNQKAPFDIIDPTEISPVFVIRDYGPGLSDEDMTELYTTYFASTKSTSNDFIGALGLGSKSPFSYTNVFVTTSYFNGVETSFVASIDGDEPTLKLAYKKETSEPNGLKIQVSIKPSDIYRFKKESERILASFPEGSYNHITDRECLRFNLDNEVNAITDPFLTDMLPGRINAVYGNIIYPIDLTLINMRHILDERVSFITDGYYVIKFNLGELDIAPSREELSYNESTIQVLYDKLNACENELMNAYIDELRGISNPRELYRRTCLLSQTRLERICEADSTILDAWIEMEKNFHTDIPVLAVYDRKGKRRASATNKTVFNTVSLDNVVVIIKDASHSIAEVIRHSRFVRRFDHPTVAVIDGKMDNIDEVMKQIHENMNDDVVFVKSSQLGEYRSSKPTTNKKSPNCIHIAEDGERTFLTLSASDIDKLSGYALHSYRDDIMPIVENAERPMRIPNIQTISRFAHCLNVPVYVFRGRTVSRARNNKNLIPFEYAVRDYIQEQIDKDVSIHDPRDSLSWHQKRILSDIVDFGDKRIINYVHELLLYNENVVIDEDVVYIVSHAHAYFSQSLVSNVAHFRDKVEHMKHTMLKNFDKFVYENPLFLQCCGIDLDSYPMEKRTQLRKQIASLAVLNEN